MHLPLTQMVTPNEHLKHSWSESDLYKGEPHLWVNFKAFMSEQCGWLETKYRQLFKRLLTGRSIESEVPATDADHPQYRFVPKGDDAMTPGEPVKTDSWFAPEDGHIESKNEAQYDSKGQGNSYYIAVTST